MKVFDTYNEYKEQYLDVPDGLKSGEVYYVKENKSVHFKTNNINGKLETVDVGPATEIDMNSPVEVIDQPTEFHSGFYKIKGDGLTSEYIFHISDVDVDNGFTVSFVGLKFKFDEDEEVYGMVVVDDVTNILHLTYVPANSQEFNFNLLYYDDFPYIINDVVNIAGDGGEMIASYYNIKLEPESSFHLISVNDNLVPLTANPQIYRVELI